MATKRIFTVGFDLPGSEFEYIEFDSDQTLLDADIILFKPTLGNTSFEYGQEVNGRRILSQSSSFSTKAKIDHWRSEIVAAVKAGKLVIVYLSRPIIYFRFTGEESSSGTGRSQVRTKHVAEISSYEAVPNVAKVTPKQGSAVQLEKMASYLLPYWNEFASKSPYEVEIESQSATAILKSKVGERVVGAAVRSGAGSLILLPPITFDEDKFLEESKEEDDDERYWTSAALKFGKRLVSVVVALADALHRKSDTTPPPPWTDAIEYRLAPESRLESMLAKRLVELDQLQADKSRIEGELRQAGSLRGLLFEQGKPLEAVVLEAMRLLGFKAQSFTDGKSEFDGVFVSLEGRCLGEVEGRDNKAINVEKFSQLERNIQEDFARDDVSEYAKAILFGNAYRLVKLGDRGDFFTSKCVSAALRTRAALVRTPDLFPPARYLQEFPDDTAYASACRESIFAAAGEIVSFPPPPTNETITIIEGGSSA